MHGRCLPTEEKSAALPRFAAFIQTRHKEVCALAVQTDCGVYRYLLRTLFVHIVRSSQCFAKADVAPAGHADFHLAQLLLWRGLDAIPGGPQLRFEGAKIGLFQLTNEGSVLRHLASRASLGYQNPPDPEDEPSDLPIHYQRGDVFVIVTDGFTDQVGGDRARMMTGKPPSIRTLTRVTGCTASGATGTKSNWRQASHKSKVASSCATIAPVQARGPRPKGR